MQVDDETGILANTMDGIFSTSHLPEAPRAPASRAIL
jgi:hypothetical protein